MQKRYLNWKGYVKPLTSRQKVWHKSVMKSAFEYYNNFKEVVSNYA